jgi:hypothetical protein
VPDGSPTTAREVELGGLRLAEIFPFHCPDKRPAVKLSRIVSQFVSLTVPFRHRNRCTSFRLNSSGRPDSRPPAVYVTGCDMERPPLTDSHRLFSYSLPGRLMTGKPKPKFVKPAPAMVKLAGGVARSIGLGVIELSARVSLTVSEVALTKLKLLVPV